MKMIPSRSSFSAKLTEKHEQLDLACAQQVDFQGKALGRAQVDVERPRRVCVARGDDLHGERVTRVGIELAPGFVNDLGSAVEYRPSDGSGFWNGSTVAALTRRCLTWRSRFSSVLARGRPGLPTVTSTGPGSWGARHDEKYQCGIGVGNGSGGLSIDVGW